MPDDDVCWQCERPPGHSGHERRTPGWCHRCGFFYDLYGQRLLEPWRTCRVHSPLRASCPHSGSLWHPDDDL